jgi:hypothetical protein
VLLAPSGDEAARLNAMAVKVISRPLRGPEIAVLQESLAAMRGHYGADPAEAAALIALGESKPDPAVPPAELAAWTMIANQLLNLDESLTK